MTLGDIYWELFPVLTVFSFILGACIGSFLNVVIWRLPRGESLVSPPSHCPRCNHAIRPWENIPILSWLFLRGRCSACKGPISPRYPAVEALTGVVFLAIWFRVLALAEPLPVLLNLFFLGGALVAVTFTDIETRTIPNKVTYSGILLGLTASLFLPASLPVNMAGTRMDGAFSHLGECHPLLFSYLPTRFGPFLSSMAGVAIPLAFLWSLRVLAGVTSGRQTLVFDPHQPLRLDSSGLHAGDETLFYWEEIVGCTLTLRTPRIQLAGEAFPGDSDGNQRVFSYRKGKIFSGGWQMPVDSLTNLRGEAVSLQVTRDVFGWGDIKLVMMIGALLGVGALPLVLAVSASIGAISGSVAMLAFPVLRKRGLPFAPFLACGCAAWIFFGRELAVLIRGFFS